MKKKPVKKKRKPTKKSKKPVKPAEYPQLRLNHLVYAPKQKAPYGD